MSDVLNNPEALIAAAEQRCAAEGKRLTRQRRDILMLLLVSDVPLSAYQLLDMFRQQFQPGAQATTVYRALEFLLDSSLIHKLESSSSYTVCDHLACDHQHEPTQFLVCQKCGAVSEVSFSSSVLSAMRLAAAEHGFGMDERALEIKGLCRRCQH